MPFSINIIYHSSRKFELTYPVYNYDKCQPSFAFQIISDFSHFIYSAVQMTSFYIKRNTGLKWVKINISLTNFD